MPQKKAIKISIEDEDNKGPAKKVAKKKKAAAPATRPKVKKKTVPKASEKEPTTAPARKNKVAKTKIAVTDDRAVKMATKKPAAKPAAPISDIETAGEAAPKADSIEETIAKSDIVKKTIADMPGQEVGEAETAEMIVPDEAAEPPKARRSIKLYRNIALSFLGLTIVLLAAVFYFLFVRVTIVLIPNQERISNNMIIDINDEEKSKQGGAAKITGVVRKISIGSTNTYEASGEEVIGEEAVGEITVINNYTKNQPLVATTRILSPDSKLYRLKNTINVPSGGQVEVDIYADEPGPIAISGPGSSA